MEWELEKDEMKEGKDTMGREALNTVSFFV
jgi:hypothetical protein